MKKRFLAVAILLLAFFGLADAVYLAESTASGTPLQCNIESLSGCNTVAQSEYSRFLGIPLADYGLLFYGLLFVLAAFELAFFDPRVRRAIQALSVVGVVASAYFTFVQVYLVEALCIYCLVSATTTLIIFLCATFLEPVRRKPGHIHIDPLGG